MGVYCASPGGKESREYEEKKRGRNRKEKTKGGNRSEK